MAYRAMTNVPTYIQVLLLLWGNHRASAAPGAHRALQWLVAALPGWGPKALRRSCSHEHGHSADLLLCLPSLHSLEAQT